MRSAKDASWKRDHVHDMLLGWLVVMVVLPPLVVWELTLVGGLDPCPSPSAP